MDFLVEKSGYGQVIIIAKETSYSRTHQLPESPLGGHSIQTPFTFAENQNWSAGFLTISFFLGRNISRASCLKGTHITWAKQENVIETFAAFRASPLRPECRSSFQRTVVSSS